MVRDRSRLGLTTVRVSGQWEGEMGVGLGYPRVIRFGLEEPYQTQGIGQQRIAALPFEVGVLYVQL